MCFSALASFAAATVLAAIGGVSLRSASSRSQLPIAAIPVLFAVQQCCEGVVWIVLEDAPFGKSDTVVARAFLFFALFLWPAYLPAALLPIEPGRGRRGALAFLSVAGATLGIYLIGCASLRASDACIAFDNLYYWVQIDTPLKRVVPYIYVGLIVVPLIVSSVRGTSLLALAALASFASTGWLYRVGFVSVWCFFAALLSGVVVLVVKAFPKVQQLHYPRAPTRHVR